MAKQFEIIEINGTKFEVDLSTAKKMEEFRVHDQVKVLKKNYDDYKIYPGVIIGFEWFQARPTIVIAYLDISYRSAEIEFLYYNKDSKDVEISHTDNLELLVKPQDVYETIDKEILRHKADIEELEAKKRYFSNHFQSYFKTFMDQNEK